MDGYSLSRQWFDFAFENPEKVDCTQTALYFFIIEKWNRFGQKEKFGLPSMDTMEILQIKSKKTYYEAFNSLVNNGFILVIQEAKNQNTSCIISISADVKNTSASKRQRNDKGTALDSAWKRQVSDTVPIDKQRNKETKKQRKMVNEFFHTYEKFINNEETKDTATSILLRLFFDLGFIPSENIEAFRSWTGDMCGEFYGGSTREMLSEAKSFHLYWKEKKITNHKLAFRNWSKKYISNKK